MTTTIHTPLRLLVARTLLALAAGFGSAQAAPTLPQVVSGQASFAQQGNVFSITNAPNTIINWQSFSVNPGEVTRFIQQSSDSAVLNRIVGQDPSKILGALQSNGQVFLINPNGILFGKDARVDVNGLTASTLHLSDADFLAGKRKFAAGTGAGKVVNQGTIATPSGGKVFLIASSIENSGIITTPDGALVLAAGHSVQLADSGNPDLHVVVSAPADEAINLGQIVAQGGRVGIYGALVRQRGIVNADSAQVGKNGKIVFKASGDTTLEAGSVTSANGAGRGGEVLVLGERVGLTGDARIDASGTQGGGTVLVGGGYQGKDARLPNARQTVFGKNAAIRADALASGDGGTVVLWANDSTRAYGSLSALGAAAGKGGLVETSAYQLDVTGIKVKAGTWLLDPYDLDIVSTSSQTLSDVDQFLDLPSTGITTIAATTLSNASASANVVLQATHDINFREAVTRTPGTTGSLTVEAGNNINVLSHLNTNGGNLVLKARQGPNATGTGSINLANEVVTGGGRLFASGDNVTVTGSAWVDTGGGDIDLRANNAFSLAAGATFRSDGFIDITADTVDLYSNIGPSGPTLPIVSFLPASANRAVDIVETGTASLHLSPSELALIHAYGINIGSSASTGPIRVGSALTLAPALTKNLVLETQGDIDIDAPLSLGGTGSTLLLGLSGPDSGRVSVNSSGSLSADKIIVRADDIHLSGNVSASSISLMPNNSATLIKLGGVDPYLENGPRELVLGEAELNHLSSSKLTIGGNDGQTGGISLLAGLNLASSGIGTAALNLQAGDGVLMFNGSLQTLGALTLQGRRIEGETGAKVSAPSIALSAYEGIGTLAPFSTGTAKLSADNYNPGGYAPINITNIGVMNLGSVTQSGIGNSGNISVLNAGGMTVMASDGGKPVTVATSGGGISLRTQSPLTIHGTVATSGGSVALEAGNGGVMTIGSGANVVSSTGSISVTGGSVVNDGKVATSGGNIVVAGTLSGSGALMAPNGTVTSGGIVSPGSGSCIANPSGAGCKPPPPTLSECISAPSTTGCAAVLPPIDTCVANPTAPGCLAVLPTLDACLANPAAPGCTVVLPSVPMCTATPSAPGCSVVLPSLTACTAAPSTAGCSAVLPSLPACASAPTTPGCSVVLPSLAACVAAPSSAGCSAVLPSLASCTATPSAAGCSVVLPSLASCTANPSAPGCSAVLPTLAQCSAAPATAGCVAVLPSLAQCTISPVLAGCAVVLPTITVCSAAPSTAGCTAVLPSLASCVATPTASGCTVVLPSLASCVATPTASGCTVVLPSLASCVATPTAPGCAVVLPSVSACVAAPGTAGCSVVLPTLSQCVATPNLPGCSVVLPTLAQCTASPTLQGCAVVLPPVSACVANPAAPGCVVVVPPVTPTPASEVGQAISNTVNVINTVVSQVSQPTTVATSTGGAALADLPAASGKGVSQEKSDSKNSSTEAPKTVRDIEGANGEKIVKKTYCN